MTTSSRPRLGVILPRTIVSLALVAVLSAVMAPRFVGVLDRSSVVDAASVLAEIDSGINAFALNVHTGNITTNQFPGRVSQLSLPILPSSRNSCGDIMGGNAPAQWASAGPFIRLNADSNGVPTSLGQIQDSIERVLPPASHALVLRIPGVDTQLAQMLDRLVDNGDGGTTGKVRFDPLVADTSSVRYLVTPRQRDKC